ncbi:hypothetical protein L1049_011936 [Liquidambar formosana]|uniref:Uncharacterized protein n=1 Tax=Liquidambar formosana TaxID=63359 RepID=A0AAP0RS85_LIQFO
MRPISCPLSDFVLPPENSEKLHPLGARKRSSCNIANAFARSRKPSSNVAYEHEVQHIQSYRTKITEEDWSSRWRHQGQLDTRGNMKEEPEKVHTQWWPDAGEAGKGSIILIDIVEIS